MLQQQRCWKKFQMKCCYVNTHYYNVFGHMVRWCPWR
jgi:hypothetical protein